MIQITDKSRCCGCTACGAVCPKECITMRGDGDGCLYPVVDVRLCVDCGMCERVCPELQPQEPILPSATYAAVNPDERVRSESSSGGVFSLLAEAVIADGGVVYGARMRADGIVAHDSAETSGELAAFRGSKYVQSDMGDCFKRAKGHLGQGRKVLFSGTPCQIAGLRRYLRRDYPGLLTVDFVCHGVPAPMVWRRFLDTFPRPKGADAKNSVSAPPVKIASWEGMSFRDKRQGWKKYGFRLPPSAVRQDGENTVSASSNTSGEFYEPFTDNRYMQMFLSDLSLRPSCYECPSKGGRSGSDITIGDFWGIQRVQPEIDDDRGMSLVMVNTQRGAVAMAGSGAHTWPQSYADALRYNPAIEAPAPRPVYRGLFMALCRACGFGAAYRAVRSQAVPVKVLRRGWLALSRLMRK